MTAPPLPPSGWRMFAASPSDGRIPSAGQPVHLTGDSVQRAHDALEELIARLRDWRSAIGTSDQDVASGRLLVALNAYERSTGTP